MGYMHIRMLFGSETFLRASVHKEGEGSMKRQRTGERWSWADQRKGRRPLGTEEAQGSTPSWAHQDSNAVGFGK